MAKIALITGATSGIGEACAHLFAREKYDLILTGRRADRLEKLAKKLNTKYNVEIAVSQFDVRNREDVIENLEGLPVKWKKVNVLVNNAGLSQGLDPIDKGSLDDWDTMIDTNVKGLMYCTRAAVGGMVERNRGHIVNIGSVAGMYNYPGGNVYGPTKAFVHHFSLNLRADLLGTAVRVTDVQPGMTSGTEFSKVRFRGDEERAAKVYEGVPATLTPGDIAEAVYWVTSQPAHVNVNSIEMMPVSQAFNLFNVHRKPPEKKP